MNLSFMFLPALLCLLVGIERGARQAKPVIEGNTLWFIGVLAVCMAIERGFYWNLFGRGDRASAANKLSAEALFAALIWSPELLRLFNRLWARLK